MRIDVGKELVDLDGAALVDKNKPLLLKTACINALLAVYPDEPNVTGEAKLSRYELAKRIHAATVIDLPVDEVAELKRLLNKAYGPIVFGAACDLLDPNADDIPAC